MPGLRELQQEFSGQVFGTGQSALTDIVDPYGVDASRRLGIYRKITFTALADALAAVFPVVQRLVGAVFFEKVSRRFIQCTPSRSGDIREFGSEFPAFLASFEPAASLGYLAEVASLEWYYHIAFNAPNSPPPNLDSLRRLEPDRFLDLKIVFHPATRILASQYPVLRIWEVNQPDFKGDQTVELAQNGVKLLVYRHTLSTRLRQIKPGEHDFLSALHRGLSISEAYESALLVDKQFSLEQVLHWHIANGTLTTFVVP